MTKIKNTKKGMAKKTLSVSLAVAMLATSNVPVWAAEFSDGADAAFTAEAPVEVEAPVVEEAEIAPAEATYTQGDYTVDVTFDKTSVTWNGDTITPTITWKKDGTTVSTGTNYAWLIGETETSANETDTTKRNTAYVTTENDFNKNIYLYMWVEENGVKVAEKTVKAAHVEAMNLADAATFSIGWDKFPGGTRTYDGKAVPKTANVNQIVGSQQIQRTDFTINYSNDLTNVGKITVTATLNDPKYVGAVTNEFSITPKNIDDTVRDSLVATLNADAKSYAYTGNLVKFDKSDVKLVDPATGDDISKMITSVVANTGDINAGKHKAIVIFANNDAVKNYNVTTTIPSVWSDEYEITARSLEDCTFTFNAIQHKNNVGEADLKAALVSVVAKDGTVLNKDVVKNNITIIPPETGMDSSSATPYTVTIKPVVNNKNFTKSTTASVRVVNKDIDKVWYDTQCTELLKVEEYTGSQITKDIAGLIDSTHGLKLYEGDPTATGIIPAKLLEYGADKNYTIEFGSNTNVKDGGQTIIVGHGDYEGSRKIINFDIKPATVTTNDLSAVSYILCDEDVTKAEEYANKFNLVVKGHNSSKKEFTLVEGKNSDYTVEYTYVDGNNNGKAANEVGDKVKATVTLTQDGNFVKASGVTTLEKEVELVAPVIRDENIHLKKDTYEYTAAPIIPEFDVVINGETLVKDVDYKILNTQDVTEVGEAKVVITGMGKYSNKVNAEAKFTVVPTSAENVKVTLANGPFTYNGKAQKPAVNAAVLSQNKSVLAQFDVSYGTNINAGKGTVILTPKKNNKNFTGTKTVEFDIEQAELTGTLTLYNDKNLIVNASGFEHVPYTGVAHTYAKEVFTPTGALAKYVTSDDYEIVYADNVYGKYWTGVGQLGHVFVIGKGNFKGNLAKASYNELASDGTFIDADNNKITSIAATKIFIIDQAEIHKNNITVSNGEYREGYKVKPEVTVVVGGKTLLEGKDYKLDLDFVTQDITKVTNSKSLQVKIEPINGYKGVVGETLVFNWGIDKFDFANSEIVVTGTDAAPVVKVLNDGILVDPDDYNLTVSDGKATVAAKEGSKNYTGTQTVEIKHELEKPETPVLASVNVTGNTATAVLSGDVEGATGYDFVIGTSRDCITTKDYVKVNKNVLKTETPFTYVQQGTYYAYCHAWKRDENGQKIFSDWSNAYPFVVTAITPDQPVITSVKASGSTVTVTYTQAANATGYDVVLGTATKKVAGETRPVNYGELVKKNVKGNTVTVTFKNVEKGTYYAGLHAFNRTSEDGKKVFSSWSNVQKVTVK